jgi:serine/threonine protein kinase
MSQEDFESFRKTFARLGIDFQDHFTGLATLGKKLAEGGNGMVFAGTLTDDGSNVAIKLVFEKDDGIDAIKELVKAEGDTLELLNDCPYLLKVKKMFVAPKTEFPDEVQLQYPKNDFIVGLITSLAGGGDLWDHWKELSTVQRYTLMEQYAKALECMADKKYVHCDIKRENLMIDWDGINPVGVVIDVGYTKLISDVKKSCEEDDPLGGTEGYFPDKLVSGYAEDCGPAVAHWDEFALGVSFQGIGASTKAGKAAVLLRRKMLKVPDDENHRWAEFVKAFADGREASEAGGDTAKPYLLLRPGPGYFKVT